VNGRGILKMWRPLSKPTISSLNISLEKTSVPRMKRKGDKGSPCFRPLEGKSLPYGLPFRRIEKEAEEMQILTQLIQEE
jgi:hypothetical protein